MREILFRGKQKDNGEWMYGAYLHQTQFYGDDVDRHWIIEHGEFDYDHYEAYQVIPETVGQYTGLTDKSGKKIFEGDILGVGTVSGYVLFKSGCFVFCWKNNDKHRLDFYKDCILTNYWGFNELEVIDNIHDNPELLEGDTDDA